MYVAIIVDCDVFLAGWVPVIQGIPRQQVRLAPSAIPRTVQMDDKSPMDGCASKRVSSRKLR